MKIMKLSKDCEVTPPFYLPVYRKENMYAVELWIFPLAPFILFWRILCDVCWIIWRDLLLFQKMIINARKGKK